MSPRTASWRADTRAAIDAALLTDNLRRLRWLGLVLPLLNLFYLLLLNHATLDDSPQAGRWQHDLQRLHLTMAATYIVLGLGTHGLLRAPQALPLLRRAWPPLAAALGLGFTLAFLAVDQQVGANITAFMLGAIVIGVLVVLHPLLSTLLYAAALAGFWIVLARVQHDPVALLASQLNGSTAGVLGWVIALTHWRQQVQNKQLTQQLQRAATIDSLTGLANRMEAVRLINDELGRGLRHSHATSLMLLDLDHFKQVNDRLGHPGGDRVLQATATLLSQTVRAHDRVGRLGGEEFVILLPQTDAPAALRLAERLRQQLAAALGPEGGVTCSIGIVTAEVGHEIGFDHLYLLADQALYRAKSAGRNRCEVAP